MQTICFTGFNKSEKNELIQLAKNKNIDIKNDITKELTYLCCGPNAGPSKIKKAQENGTLLISEDGFKGLLSGLDLSPASTDTPVQATPAMEPEKLSTSIYDEHPLLDYLWSAIDKNNVISIIYHGGTNSGSERKIIPRSLNENFVLSAVDTNDTQRQVKSFSVEKIEIIGLERVYSNDTKNLNNKKSPARCHVDFKSIGEVYSEFKDTLEGMGWYVATHIKDGECIRIDICDYFKNGKPHKTPVVTLYFEPENTTRPYVCKCREIELANTYSNLNNAALMFINLAHEAASINTFEIK
ncbi:BRCT domain-containing protein [Serratia proteamaculans]